MSRAPRREHISGHLPVHARLQPAEPKAKIVTAELGRHLVDDGCDLPVLHLRGEPRQRWLHPSGGEVSDDDSGPGVAGSGADLGEDPQRSFGEIDGIRSRHGEWNGYARVVAIGRGDEMGCPRERKQLLGLLPMTRQPRGSLLRVDREDLADLIHLGDLLRKRPREDQLVLALFRRLKCDARDTVEFPDRALEDNREAPAHDCRVRRGKVSDRVDAKSRETGAESASNTPDLRDRKPPHERLAVICRHLLPHAHTAEAGHLLRPLVGHLRQGFEPSPIAFDATAHDSYREQ